MNQILSTQPNEKNNKVDTKKIVIFFCILIVAFGIILGGIGIYNFQKNKQETKKEVEKTKPIVEILQEENVITLNVKHNLGIQSVKYSLNSGDTTVIQVYNEEEWERQISIDEGTTILKISVVLSDNSEYEYPEKLYTYESNIKIDLLVSEGSDIVKLIATDDKELVKIQYKWNDEEFTTIDQEANAEDKTKIETTIKLKRGNNTLAVIGVDNADNKRTKTQEFSLTKKPTIDTYKDGSLIVIQVSHDIGIVKTEVSINGINYAAEEEGTFLEYKLPLQEGENIIEVKTYSIEDTIETIPIRCEYTP